jgi:hypothetical protein
MEYSSKERACTLSVQALEENSQCHPNLGLLKCIGSTGHTGNLGRGQGTLIDSHVVQVTDKEAGSPI